MNALYMTHLTKPQRKAVYKVFMRYCHTDNTHPLTITYREFRKRVFNGSGCVMLQPTGEGMWLGIEPDGYTHS
jgi:hypothetical protein